MFKEKNRLKHFASRKIAFSFHRSLQSLPPTNEKGSIHETEGIVFEYKIL
jgi:hypothetical protein